ncbi:hypothetical protein QMK19_16475 [Streptomyces sp. H10-C2]|uniref:hypothetical protein n=1 Tax=unclassified Streptomyces TaxID=2593676 RepID=UPI0024B9E453|nr:MULTISPECIES: hypothetical protein [unclassified Streptomyces]MDJ0344745.1 hypothetical protein [Streptomyces sp. PH10-H1]MDJ0371236.1 hypothetical protein [Streptomyces sp. H10-C2]
MQLAHEVAASLIAYRDTIVADAGNDDASSNEARLAFAERRDKLIEAMRISLLDSS